VVTKMWPTAATSFANGFLQVQIAALRDRGVRCDVLVPPPDSRGLLGYLKTARLVRHTASSERYDLIHAHYGMTAVPCLFQRHPLVVTFHGSDIYGTIKSSGRKSLKGHLERLASRLVAWRANIVIVVSSRMAAISPWAKPIVVPVGIDTELFRPTSQRAARRRLGLDGHKPLVLFAAHRDNPVKRYWLADKAVSLLRQQVPEATLVAVSGERLDQMPLWMNAADVLLITSAFEGGPMVHREAMACNLPVVSVDVGDVAFHLNDVRECHVVADDARALADALQLVLATRNRSNGRAVAKRNNTESTTNALASIYVQLVGPRDTRS
jgi:teichuronic acid biosynthesis glycosyltransferase TuaC